MACVAVGCKSHMGVLSENNTKISFHRFPKEPQVRNKWIRNLRRDNWTPSQYSRLCSLHFVGNCFREGFKTRTLRSDAVPTIFSTHYLQQVIKNRAELSQKKLYCALSFDEMAIRKKLEWDGANYHGLVTIGNNNEPEDIPLAKEVFVLMLTCINDYWKIPIGYFFIDGISGTQKCTLVQECLKLLDL